MVLTSTFSDQVLREIRYIPFDSACLQSEIDDLASSLLYLSSFLVILVLDLVLHGLFPPFSGVDRSPFAFFQMGGEGGMGRAGRQGGAARDRFCVQDKKMPKVWAVFVKGFFQCFCQLDDC
jgi:hypothetical protein